MAEARFSPVKEEYLVEVFPLPGQDGWWLLTGAERCPDLDTVADTGSEVLPLGATVFSVRLTLLAAPNLNALGSVWWPSMDDTEVKLEEEEAEATPSNLFLTRLTAPVLIGEGERRRMVLIVGLGLLRSNTPF